VADNDGLGRVTEEGDEDYDSDVEPEYEKTSGL